ncbi:hypothetical protein C2U69_08885 [Cupriavidus pinatubonensis]|nr:hypothetical protein C2U69_08885 [Cupriavidus pinatubonensis]
MVASGNPQAYEYYKRMREEFATAEEVDKKTYETIVVVQFAMLGKEVQFKIHAIRLFSLGCSKEYLQALLLVGLGLTVIMCDAARALKWTDEAYEEFLASRCLGEVGA